MASCDSNRLRTLLLGPLVLLLLGPIATTAAVISARLAPATSTQQTPSEALATNVSILGYACSLSLQGFEVPATSSANPPFNTTHNIQSASLSCTAVQPNTPPLQVRYNDVLQSFLTNFTGVQAVPWQYSSGSSPSGDVCSAPPVNTTALLWFCGLPGTAITFQSPVVSGVMTQQGQQESGADNAVLNDIALLAFGADLTVVIEHGAFVDNQAGSAIMIKDSVSLNVTQSSLFVGNIARNGGALHVCDRALVTVTDRAIISSNTADFGGGVYVRGNGSITIAGASLLQGNRADSAKGKGGALYAKDNARVAVSQGSTVDGNTAADGGGIMLEDQAVCYIVEGAKIYQNAALYKTGGGVSLTDTAELVCNNASIVYNTANKQGGGIGMDDGSSAKCLVLNASLVAHNTAVQQGGGLYLGPGNVALVGSGSRFEHNYAKSGGGAFIGGEDAKQLPTATDLVVTDPGTVFVRNTAVNGGALNVYGVGERDVGCQLVVSNGVLIANNSASEGGGGFVANSACTVKVGSSSLVGNSAVKAGGAFSAYGYAFVNIANSTIANGSAKDAAAGSIGLNASVTVEGSRVSTHRALHNGGAFGVSGNADLLLTDTVVDGNAALIGGALDIQDNGTVSLNNSTLANNSAAISGGAANVLGPGSPRLVLANSSRCVNNSASVMGGCACLVSGGLFEIYSGSFVEYNSAHFGGGLAVIAVQSTDAAAVRSSRLVELQQQVARGANRAESDVFGPDLYVWPS